MNPLTKAINDIKMTIPKEILDLAYNNEYNNMESMESKIETVLRSRVLVDTNLVGGVTIHIDMSKVKLLESDEYGGLVVEIPEILLGGRSILSVHSLVTSLSSGEEVSRTHTGESTCSSSGDLMQTANKILDNTRMVAIELTSNIEMIGERIVYIRDNITEIRDTVLRLVVENQSLLSNLPPRAYINFSMLCSRAIKADIYNRLIVKLDQGLIHTGHQLGIVQTLVDNYSDMNELYLEYLTDTWTSVVFMSDSTEMNSYVSSLFGNA